MELRYKVIRGIFSGLVFKGCVNSDKTRIINLNTIGQSYPIENCCLVGLEKWEN
jgi:hypothetical protein